MNAMSTPPLTPSRQPPAATRCCHSIDQPPNILPGVTSAHMVFLAWPCFGGVPNACSLLNPVCANSHQNTTENRSNFSSNASLCGNIRTMNPPPFNFQNQVRRCRNTLISVLEFNIAITVSLLKASWFVYRTCRCFSVNWRALVPVHHANIANLMFIKTQNLQLNKFYQLLPRRKRHHHRRSSANSVRTLLSPATRV